MRLIIEVPALERDQHQRVMLEEVGTMDGHPLAASRLLISFLTFHI